MEDLCKNNVLDCDMPHAHNSAINNNNNSVIDSNINNDAGFVVGIFNSGSTNSETINGNTMHDFSNTNTKGTYSYTYGTSVSATGIYASSSTGAREIHQDTIYSLSSLGGFVTGIQITGSSSSMNISRNKIYDLAQTDNPYNSAIYGISAQAGDSVLITNNLIGNLTTTAANNSANGLIGIISQGPSAVWAYYNTIYLNDTTSSRNTAFGCQDFYCNISTALTLNNNIFVNTSTGGGGTSGYATCIAWNKTPISYDASSNNNLFYAGTPGIGTNNYIYYDNTNLLDSLSAYQALVSPSDSMAVTENPPFLSTSGASYYFLHIDPAKKTQIESGAIAISGITDDYDSTGSRPVGGYPLKGQIYGGGTAPDIGADEFDGSIILKSWIGITSTDWNTSSNWYGGKIPGVTDDAFIPASAPHQPLLGSGVAYCNNITIDSLASLGISGGSFFLNGNLTCNGTYNHTGGMMFFAGNKAQNIYSKKSLTFYKLNSYGKGAKTLNEDITIVDSLIISDSLADNGHVITAKGNINNNGAESGKGKILLSTNGSSMHTITGNGIYTNLDLNDSIGAISSGNAIVSNTLNIDKGSLAIWTKTFTANKVNISASGTLNITGGSFYLLGDFNNAGTYSHSGGTMIFSGTSAQQIKSNSALTFFKLNSSGTGIKTLNANSTISDSLVIGSTLEDNGNIITARANINISGIHSSTGSGHILLANGATSHNLSGNGKYDNLTINDTAGAVLYANPVISGVLTLSKGNIRVGIHKLIIAQKGSIASGSSSSYIVTDNTGKLYRAGMDTAAFTFPIGTKSSFAPVIFDDSLNSGDSISMRVQSETSSSSFAPALPTGALTNVNLQWQIDEAMKGGSHAKLSFAWNAADESGTIASPAVIAQSNGTAWTATNASLGTHKASAGGFAAFSSPFAIYTIKLTGIGEMGTEDKTDKVWYNQDIKKLQVLFSESKNLVIKMKIIDALGKVVVEKDINATEGNNEAQFDMNGFARGLYTFIFYSGHEVQTSKFIRY